jgi:hypothetical protein
MIGSKADSLWRPDTFFRQSRREQLHMSLAPNQYARVKPDGSVRYSARVAMTLACPGLAGLKKTGKHVCKLDVASCKFF